MNEYKMYTHLFLNYYYMWNHSYYDFTVYTVVLNKFVEGLTVLKIWGGQKRHHLVFIVGHPSVNFHTFDISSKFTGPILAKLAQKGAWEVLFVNCVWMVCNLQIWLSKNRNTCTNFWHFLRSQRANFNQTWLKELLHGSF